MNSEIIRLYEHRANIFKALAHPSRLFIVDQLSKSEKCVCELQKMIGNDMSTVSKHLSILKNAGIIEARKEGNQMFYKLKFTCVTSFFDCVENVIRKNNIL